MDAPNVNPSGPAPPVPTNHAEIAASSDNSDVNVNNGGIDVIADVVIEETAATAAAVPTAGPSAATTSSVSMSASTSPTTPITTTTTKLHFPLSTSTGTGNKKTQRFDRAVESFVAKFTASEASNNSLPEDYFELATQIEAIEPQLQRMWSKLEQAVDEVDQNELQYLIDCKKGLEERYDSARRYVADAKVILENVDQRYQDAKKNNDIQASIGLQKLKQNAEKVTTEGRNIDEREMARRMASGEDAKLDGESMLDDKHPRDSLGEKTGRFKSGKKSRSGSCSATGIGKDTRELKTEAQFRKWLNAPYVIDAVSYKSPNAANQPIKVLNGLAYCICCNMKQVDWKQLRRHFLSQKHKHLKAAYEGNPPTINSMEANAIVPTIVPPVLAGSTAVTGTGSTVTEPTDMTQTCTTAAGTLGILKTTAPINSVDDVLEKLSTLRRRELEVRDDDLLPEMTKNKLMEKIKRRKIELCDSLEAVQGQEEGADVVDPHRVI